ncbi:PREDICTED: uncharacterized protein LOC109170242 isoform X2 [Ipomoea nil]|uniref:uncharacterized protein LOC109170242 isoform X2 n=1 Tax=Ipomoea nil TaxID=35883 RepID=UPI00090112C7|nr:PREDICTED: uncharacterized protein LOC109170242 isoform X2 [Ipomoea nil]
MEILNESIIVIVGAGIAGLSTSLALHRVGLKSLVLESSGSLRTTGFGLATWTNAWRALDALGVGNALRQKSLQFSRFEVFSVKSGKLCAELSLKPNEKPEDYDSRCLRRSLMIEAIAKELPQGTIRLSSKVVSIQESGPYKLLHLLDGCIIKCKVVIGADGINSVVAKWMGLEKPVDAKRSAIRGYVEFPEGSGFGAKFRLHLGGGVRLGILPCDDKSLYWFCTFTPADVHLDQDPMKMKQFVLDKAAKRFKEATDIVERTSPENISGARLSFRSPWNVLFGDIVKGNVCLVGDALHAMTPDIGEGGCSALEDSVVLGRCLGEAVSKAAAAAAGGGGGEDCVEKGLRKYAKERRWRVFDLITTSYVVGLVQERNGDVITVLRDYWLAKRTIRTMLKRAHFDCGKLITKLN